MVALLTALKANGDTVREVHIHDNWIKGEAVDRLVEFVLSARKLECLNVSDSTMGTDAAVLVVKAMSTSQNGLLSTLKHFGFNFNEVETSKASRFILDTLLS